MYSELEMKKYLMKRLLIIRKFITLLEITIESKF